MNENGTKSYHWIVPSWIEAVVLGGKLKEFIGNPNLIFLKIKANNDSSIEDITFKDERKLKKMYPKNQILKFITYYKSYELFVHAILHAQRK